MAFPADSYHDGNISPASNERIVREIQHAARLSRLTEAEKLAREDDWLDALERQLGPARPAPPPPTYKWYAPPVGNWPDAKGDSNQQIFEGTR